MRGIYDYAVVYDISCDRERSRIDRVLKNFGFRIQKSVFECRLTRKGRDELIGKLEELDVQTGFIKLYRLEYASKKLTIGVQEKKGIDEGHAFIV